MTDKVAEIRSQLGIEDKAASIVNLWENWNNQRQEWLHEKEELLRYIHATDTSTTSNKALPWKNSTTIPKLTQIRDNLHTNYMASLFPNEKWLTWQAYDQESASQDKAKVIVSYMSNKLRESSYEDTVSQIVLDYIDFGNAFFTADYETRYNVRNEEIIPSYVGPKSVRINPLDIVFNPTASDFRNTPKIIRSRKSIGELLKLAKTSPENSFWLEAVKRRQKVREVMSNCNVDDFIKANLFTADGFGDMNEYYKGDIVEILEFYGDFFDPNAENLEDALKEGVVITVVDRSMVVREEKINTYDGRDKIRHIGWRKRNGNLWAQGPLDNLVGMQYRLDHLENAKADAWDLAIHAPLKIIGDVEEFLWGPGCEIHLDEGGDVQEVVKNLSAIITADNQMEIIMSLMELMAGAPREAMGVRSPGEKTAFEVQVLDNAASRIFQSKVKHIETMGLEPNINDMFELAHLNMEEGTENIRIMDNDLGATIFQQITKADITAKGVLRPIGARHFAQKSNELQSIIGVLNSRAGDIIAPHTSGINLARFIEDVTDIRGYKIFRPNVAIMENQETQALAGQAQEENMMAAEAPMFEDAVEGLDEQDID